MANETKGRSWFLSEEFKKLKGDYMPGDFTRYMVKKEHKKNTPHVEKKIFFPVESEESKEEDSNDNSEGTKEDSNNNSEDK